MVYCEQCGAANDMLNFECHRCGQTLARVLEPASQGGQSEREAAVAGPASDASSAHETDLGSGLELPEWLRRAAAATPQVTTDSLESTQQVPP